MFPVLPVVLFHENIDSCPLTIDSCSGHNYNDKSYIFKLSSFAGTEFISFNVSTATVSPCMLKMHTKKERRPNEAMLKTRLSTFGMFRGVSRLFMLRRSAGKS